jgi:hypothetical protein
MEEENKMHDIPGGPEEEPNENNISEDEFIEEEVDVEDIANSNRTLINALASLLIEKGIILEDELLEKATSDDLPDYDVSDGNEESDEQI